MNLIREDKVLLQDIGFEWSFVIFASLIYFDLFQQPLLLHILLREFHGSNQILGYLIRVPRCKLRRNYSLSPL